MNMKSAKMTLCTLALAANALANGLEISYLGIKSPNEVKPSPTPYQVYMDNNGDNQWDAQDTQLGKPLYNPSTAMDELVQFHRSNSRVNYVKYTKERPEPA